MLTKERSRRCPAKTITDADYDDYIALLANTPAQAETLLHSLERATACIGHHVNTHKTEYISFSQTGDISTLNGSPLKLVDMFTYLGSSVSSTETDINPRLAKAWAAIDRLPVIWKSDLDDKNKRSFFQAAVMLILLYGCTTWTLTKRMEKKLDGKLHKNAASYIEQVPEATPHKATAYSATYHPSRKLSKLDEPDMRDTAGEVGDELISDILIWNPSHGRAKAGWPARTYIQQLCVDTRCSPEDLLEVMDDREGWRERVSDNRADSVTWWWWWFKEMLSYGFLWQFAKYPVHHAEKI